MNKSIDLREHITEVVKTLQVSTEDFHLVSLYKYEDILVSILNKFTVLGKKGIGCNWWWNNFKKPTASVYHEYPPGILEQLIPSQEKVWFIVEDTHSGKQNGFHFKEY